MNITNAYPFNCSKMSSLPNFLRSMVEKSPLANDGSNYSEWYLKLCIVLRLEDSLHILDDSVPVAEKPNAPTDAENEAQKKWNEQDKIVQALILATIGDQLQKKFINHSAREIMAELAKLFTDNAKTKECSVLAVTSSSKEIAKIGNKKSKSEKTLSAQKGKSGGSASKGSTKNTGSECFYCHKMGHFKKNCPKHECDLNGGKVEKKRPKGILVIELNLNLATSIQDWVVDTGSCAHLVSNVQALRDRRSLSKGDVVLKVGNGSSISAVTVGSLDLHLSSGLVLNLKNVYYVPSVFRNIISVSCLDTEGFCF